MKGVVTALVMLAPTSAETRLHPRTVVSSTQEGIYSPIKRVMPMMTATEKPIAISRVAFLSRTNRLQV